MRTIKFRGKRLDNGEWLEGNLIIKHRPTEIEDVFWCALIQDGALSAYEVDPDTVGQFTGLTDKNGKEIWEGDIVKIQWNLGNIQNGTIIYSDSGFYIRFDDDFELSVLSHTIEVIGNIHDNPELL